MSAPSKGRFARLCGAVGGAYRAAVNGYNKIDEALYPIIGLRSYEKYLEHFRSTHASDPDAVPMSREDFFRASQDAKEKNPRC